MQKIPRIKIISKITIFSLALFLMTGLVYADTNDESGAESTSDNTHVESNDKKLKRKPVRPSAIPTRTKVQLNDLKSTTNNESRSKDVKNIDGAKDKRSKALDVENRVRNTEDEQGDQKKSRANIQEKREDKKARLDEKRKEVIHAHLERILNRFRAAIARLDKLADRVDSRIKKLEETRDADLSKASTLVDESQSKLEDARNALASIKSDAENALTDDDPKNAFKKVKEILNGAKEDIKDAHKKLIEAIRLVKASLPGKSVDENDAPEAVTN